MRKNSKIELTVPLTNSKTGKAEYFTNKANFDFFEILRAAMAIPFAYNKVIRIADKTYFDGAFSDPLPIDLPGIKESRKIIILTTSKENGGNLDLTIEKFFSFLLKRKISPSIANFIENRYEIYKKKVKQISCLEECGDIIIKPSKEMSRFNNNPKAINENIRQGYKDVTSNKKIKQLIQSLKKSKNGNGYFTRA